MSVADQLREIGLELPPRLQSVGAYAPAFVDGDSVWVAGHTSRTTDSAAPVGVVGADLSVEKAAREAEKAALNLVAAADGAVGLDRLVGVTFLRGYVRATPDFTAHPKVINGASELLARLFPDAAPHARAALGVASLPGGACVELEAVFRCG